MQVLSPLRAEHLMSVDARIRKNYQHPGEGRIGKPACTALSNQNVISTRARQSFIFIIFLTSLISLA